MAGAAAPGAPGDRDAADGRPGSRDLVLDARQPPRLVRGPARRRPVRRQRRVGTGSAIPRRRARQTFVENDARAAAAIKANASALGALDRVQILGGSALVLPKSAPFDLVFADPPYAPGSGTAAVGRSPPPTGSRPTVGWRSKPREPTPSSREPGQSMRPAMSAAPGLRFCARFSLFRRLLDFLEFGR